MNVSESTSSTDSRDDQVSAILEAAAAEFEQFGLRGASVERIAQAAGVSRSTLYRRFPNKHHLLIALGEHQRREFQRSVVAIIKGLNPRAAVIEAFVFAAARMRDDLLTQRLLAEEPDSLTLIAGFGGPDAGALVQSYGQAIARSLRHAGANMPEDELLTVAELQFRILMSVSQAPTETLMFRDDEQIRDFARRYLAPLVW